MEELYKNKKNGLPYVIVDEVINCTNDQDGQKMYLYRPANKNLLFVREKNEFHEKFEKFVVRGPKMSEGEDVKDVLQRICKKTEEAKGE